MERDGLRSQQMPFWPSLMTSQLAHWTRFEDEPDSRRAKLENSYLSLPVSVWIRSANTSQQMRMGAVQLPKQKHGTGLFQQSWLTLPGEVGLYVENPCTWPRRAEVAFPALYWPKRVPGVTWLLVKTPYGCTFGACGDPTW